MPRDVAPVRDIDQFEATAAEIADNSVRFRNSGQDALTGEIRFLGSSQHLAVEADASTSRTNSAPSAASRTAAVATTRVCFTFICSISNLKRRSAASVIARGPSGNDPDGSWLDPRPAITFSLKIGVGMRSGPA